MTAPRPRSGRTRRQATFAAHGLIPSRFQGVTGVVLVAAVLTLAMAIPVLRAPGSRLFGSEIVGRHEAPLIVISQFENPRPPGLYTQPFTDYLGAAVTTLTGDGVIAYNAVVLTTFPLAAAFAYLLAFQLTRSRPASWLAGLLYAFAPFHIAQSAYHPHGAQTQWLPLYLLALWLCLERAGTRRLILLALSVALVALSNFYYGLIAAVITPFAVAGFWVVQRHRMEDPPRGLRRTLVSLAALAAAGLTYVAAFAPAVLDQRERLAFPRSDLALYGAHWSSYLTPPVGHPLLGPWVREVWNQRGLGGLLEQQITVGLGLGLLALVALIIYLKGDRDEELAAAPALALIAAAAFVVSLAPAPGLVEEGPEALLRPSGMVHAVLPMFRAYARFGLVVFLAVAILAAAGATRLLQGQGLRGRALGAVLLFVVLAELVPFPPFRWRDVLPTSAHRFLNDRADAIRVLDCASPHEIAERPSFFRFAHRISLRSGNGGCGDPDFPTKLAQEGFTHMLVRRQSTLGDWLARRPAPAGATQVGPFKDALLYELEAPRRAGLYLEFNQGFYWREFVDQGSYRWMKRTGVLVIVNPSTAKIQLEVELKLHAFPQPRKVFVETNGSVIAELEVGIEPDTYRLPAVAIAPGRHALTLRAASPAVVADSILENGDLRELSVALWGWTLRPHAPIR